MICGIQKHAHIIPYSDADGDCIWEGEQHVPEALAGQLGPLLHVELVPCIHRVDDRDLEPYSLKPSTHIARMTGCAWL